MTDSDPRIIPFGKYKGRLVDEVLLDDPAYLQWLAGQDWFRGKFNILHQVIINRGAEPEETPDHNTMQVKFLNDDFCLRFMRSCLEPKIESKIQSELNQRRERNLTSIDRRIEWLSRSYLDDKHGLLRLRSARQIVSTPIDKLTFKISREFEEKGIDVCLTLYAGIDAINDIGPYKLGIDHEWCWVEWRTNFKIEIKPVIGDDYPAVLRQMKANGSDVLFVGEYRGQKATQEQFVNTFATAKIRVVFAHDVDAT
jgi:uncharacterized protein (DUF3820 family)